MGQGVNFTRDGARRISNVVREVENQSRPKNVLDRRRAGGLSRLTLWEVTAVQTGPETVTIKRVDNTDFDLNDPSEKTDILYDPNDAPSVGDRGLLIRLGSGSLYFFRRLGINRIYIDKISTVIPASPDSSYLDTGTAIIINPTNVTIQIGIFKFTSPLPYIAAITDSEDVFLSLKQTTLFGRPLSTTVSVGKVQELNLVPKLIVQDFDITNLTYNIYLTLDAISPTPFAIWNLGHGGGFDPARIKHRVFTVAGAITSIDQPSFMRSFFLQDPKRVYGFAIEFAWVQGGAYENGDFNWNISRVATEHAQSFSYIEWGI